VRLRLASGFLLALGRAVYTIDACACSPSPGGSAWRRVRGTRPARRDGRASPDPTTHEPNHPEVATALAALTDEAHPLALGEARSDSH
jgi:hypothetical protein